MRLNRRGIQVRLADNEEGHRVAELAQAGGFEFKDWEMDWSQIHPHWLVADLGGSLLGCLQVCYGRPVGRLEILAVDKKIETPTRAYIVKLLLNMGCGILREYGAEAASGLIPFKLHGYKRFLKKRGAVITDSGNIFLYRMGLGS